MSVSQASEVVRTLWSGRSKSAAGMSDAANMRPDDDLDEDEDEHDQEDYRVHLGEHERARRDSNPQPLGLGPPHNCWHSPWSGAHMGPAGQVGCTAGCGWGFEADLIPAHSPMMSRTRMIHPIPRPPIHWLPERPCPHGHRLWRPLRQALREQVTRPPTTSRTPSKIAISTIEAASPSVSGTLHPSTAGWVMPILPPPWCLSPSSDLRITRVFPSVARGFQVGAVSGWQHGTVRWVTENDAKVCAPGARATRRR